MPASTRTPACQPGQAERRPHENGSSHGPPYPSDAFLSAVRRSVHELNNLLTAIACHCDLLRTAAPGPDEIPLDALRVLVRQASQEVQRLSQSCARETIPK